MIRSDAEHRLGDAGILREDEDFFDAHPHTVLGFLAVEPYAALAWFIIRPDLEDDHRHPLVAFGESEIRRLMLDGPDDGWRYSESTSTYQRWIRSTPTVLVTRSGAIVHDT